MTSGRKNLGRTIREEIVRRMNVVEGSPKQTHPTSFKFDDNTMDLVKALSEKLGVGMTNVVRLAVRKLANHEKVKL